MEYTCHGSLQNSPQSCTRLRSKTCETAFWKFWTRVSGAAHHVSYPVLHPSSFNGIHPNNITLSLYRGIMQQHVTKCMERTEERVSWLLALEDRPFTMNNHYLSDYRSKFLAHYKGARKSYQQPDTMKSIQSFSSSLVAHQMNAGYGVSQTGVA